MYEYKEVQVTQTRICKVTCNKCGKVVDFGDHDFQTEVDFTTIKNTYGFGSSKDGDKYVSHICEPCMDEIYATFAIPPQVVGMSEWGTEPADPIVIASQNCAECGGTITGSGPLNRLEEHVVGCSKFPF